MSKKNWQPTQTQGLYLRDSGSYYSRYYLKGKTVWRCLKTTNYNVAKLKQAKIAGRIEVIRQSGAEIKPELRTMGDLAAIFLKLVAEYRGADTTKEVYINSLNRLRDTWHRGNFENFPIKQITKEVVLSYRNHLQGVKHRRKLNKNTRLSVNTINRTLMTLKALIKIAVDECVTPLNPFEGGYLLTQSIFLKKNQRIPVIPSNIDLSRIFKEILNTPTEDDYVNKSYLQKIAVNANHHARFLAYSGMRKGEANECKWEDILEEENMIMCRGKKTKNALRKIPIMPEMRQLLDEIRQNSVGRGYILKTKSSRFQIQRSCERLGLPKLTHHDLRHYFATVCVESGVNIPTVADWLGHGDGGALLMKTYRHLRKIHSTEMAKLVNFGSEEKIVQLNAS